LRVGGEDDGDEDDCQQIVDNRQGQQQDAHAGGQHRAREGENAERERDVGGNRDRPSPVVCGRAPRHRQGDKGGDDHPSDGGKERQRRCAAVRQLPDDQFALELQAGDEEEDGE